MVQPDLKAWLARPRFALANPDWLLVAGALLALGAVVLHLFVLPARAAAIEAAEARLAESERDNRRAQIDRRLAQATPELARLGQIEGFSDETRLHGDLGRLLELAAEGGLKLTTGDYRLLAGKEKLFDRYVLTLPVQGGYHELRRYLAALRAEFPAIAIEDVSLRRDNIGAGQVDAQLRLVIFSRRQETR